MNRSNRMNFRLHNYVILQAMPRAIPQTHSAFYPYRLSTDLANMDANTLNYWLSKFVQEVANSEGKVYSARTLYETICGIRRHLEETVGSEALNREDASDKR